MRMTSDEQPEYKESRKTRKIRLPSRFSNPPNLSYLKSLCELPKKADELWSRDEWISLCGYLHNGNGPTQFVMGFRDGQGRKQYVRSKTKPIDRAISWAWATITGKSK